jgi:ABC-type antimicrobial peptide transport system permease subunit
MNTMFAAVSQRIKDIGVLRIVGYKRWQILGSFLIESMLLAIFGGGLGMLIGYLCNGMEQVGFMSAGQGGGKTIVFTMKVNWDVLKMGIGFTLVMGVLGGFLPSLAAMRQRPLEALR